MPRPPIDLHSMVRRVLQSTSPLQAGAAQPIQHFELSANSGSNLLIYLEDHIPLDTVYKAGFDRHFRHLHRMVLAELIESFERFLKELAAACLDILAPYCVDDRFDEFVPKRGAHLGAFVNAGSIGKALCESDTWLNNESINRRFRYLLQQHFGDPWEFLFPGPSESPAAERLRAASLAILWQIRHNLAHNVGVLTQSDAKKFRILVGGPVPADCRLSPTTEDLRYVKRFLFETSQAVNQRVANRVAVLLTAFHATDAMLFDALAKADDVSTRLATPVTIAGQVGTVQE